MKSASAAPSAEQAAAAAEQAAADCLHPLQPPAGLASQLASAHAQQQALQQRVQSQQQQLQAQAQQSQRELRAPPPQQASPATLQAQTSGRSSGALGDLGDELDSGALGGGRWDSGARQRRRRAAWTIQSCVLKRQASAALHLGGLGLGLGLGLG